MVAIRDERNLRGQVSSAIASYPGRPGHLSAAKELFVIVGRGVDDFLQRGTREEVIAEICFALETLWGYTVDNVASQ